MRNRTTKIKRDCLNFDNIDRDFDVYCVKKESKFDVNVLDALKDDYKALSVQYMYGAKALVLFKKDQYEVRQIKNRFKTEFGDDVTVDKVDLKSEKKKIENNEKSEYFYWEGRLLLQLLFNSLNTPESASYRFNNISGKLLYLGPSPIQKKKNEYGNAKNKISRIDTLEIVIEPGMYLCLNTLAFIPGAYKNKPLYVFDQKTKIFRRKLKTDDESNVFHAGNYPNTHATINYLGIGTTQAFENSKLGILAKFCEDVKEKLSDYVDLHFEEFEYINYEEAKSYSKLNIDDTEYGKRMNELGLVIVDENKTETSKEFIRKLQKELNDVYGIFSIVGDLDLNMYNIRIIHDKKSLEYKRDSCDTKENESQKIYDSTKDPYNQRLDDYIVQHMVEEENHFEFNMNTSPSVRKVVKELIIKKDIKDRKITISNWENYNSNKEWTFVIRKSIKEKAEHVNRIGNKVAYYFTYFRLLVKKDGSLVFDMFSDKDVDLDKEEDEICRTFDNLHNKSFRIRNQVECLVYSDIHNMNAIIRTPECPLPNFENLSKALEISNDNTKVEIEKIMISMEEFENLHPELNEKINSWKEEVKKYSYKISYKKLKQIINLRSGEGKLFNDFLTENNDVVLNPGIRQKGNDKLYQLSSILDIQYMKVENDFDYMTSYKYVVGYKNQSINRSYPRQCVIRKIVSSNNDEIVIKELLPMMTVDFVRENQFTVVPFPLKYLRDWASQVTRV